MTHNPNITANKTTFFTKSIVNINVFQGTKISKKTFQKK